MKIPKYWAKALVNVKNNEGRDFALTCWRWSEVSQADAVQLAETRAREIAQKFAATQQLDRYGYADRPLREEIVESIGDSAIITRNSYGALVLNAARAMFIDIDFETKAKSGGLFGRNKNAPTELDKQLDRIAAWSRQQPQWSLRVYRTAGGLRGLITNELFDPAQPASTEVLNSLNSDPLYVRLCKAQECFRARLTPKPWRCGVIAPPSGYPWPSPNAEMKHRQWERNYEMVANSYTTCQLVKEFGSASMPAEVARIVEIHDRYACRGGGLGLA
jgi:hypothetical protein